MNKQRGFITMTAADWMGFVAFVAVVGWAVIEGACWIARHLSFSWS